MASTVSFDSPLAKTIMLLTAVGLLLFVFSKHCNWGNSGGMVRAHSAEGFELEPVTFGMEDFEGDDDAYNAEFFEDEDAEEFYNDDEDMEGFEDDEPEEYDDDEEM